jgi:hypothetical protein
MEVIGCTHLEADEVSPEYAVIHREKSTRVVWKSAESLISAPEKSFCKPNRTTAVPDCAGDCRALDASARAGFLPPGADRALRLLYSLMPKMISGTPMSLLVIVQPAASPFSSSCMTT